ncbi:MAG: radical SAM-associated putative lipoprotein [Bacteroidota bacterium]
MLFIKKIRKILISKYSLLLSMILGLLGIQVACDRPDEYGCPAAKFKVIGTIESDSTGSKIQNISVTNGQYDTIYSDFNGFYQIQISGPPLDTVTFQIHFADIDNTQNGNFQNLDTIVEFDNPQFTNGDGDWYAGETSKEFNVKLKPKN